ncbi:unnamed protein product [Adineta steineri]|uniref:Uncharacterized protein n=1 Tax=Adineta steineri TaxID=433720 RepID=A0A815M7G9_9BILA|nr:unnamed protein product [Adineta steineri]CAF1418628.1 unnamed protein product [Adineta steineri]
MSSEPIRDAAILECGNCIMDTCVAQERKIIRKKAQIMEIIFKSFELEQSDRMIFGAIFACLCTWGLFINSKEITSFYTLHAFYVVLGLILYLLGYISMKLIIVDILPTVEEQNLQQQQSLEETFV